MSLLAALQARVASMLGRCLLLAVANEAGGFRKLQVQVRAGTVRDDVEQFEPYGFAASPHMGDNPQGMYAELGGAAGHPVVIVVHAPAARPRNLAPGEVAV
ncbi:MAG: phage baseplate assembly protein, partial [Rhodospirillales bacterium]